MSPLHLLVTWGIAAHLLAAWGITPLLATWGVAARPFLPAGQGGLILIAGGLSMTAMAMLMLMARHRPIPSHSSTGRTMAAVPSHAASTAQLRPQGSTQIARAVRKPQKVPVTTVTPANPVGKATPTAAKPAASTHGDEHLVWPAYVRSAAAKAGLHNTVILSVDRTRCIMEVRNCRSCRRGRKGCENERKRLLKAARRLSRRARVREVSCDQAGRRICTFHIDMGARR